MAALSLPSSGQSDVTVTVTDLGSGQALAGATVDVWFYPSGPDASSETSIETDSAGVATVANLPAGSLQMRITHPDIAYVMAWRYLWVDGSTDQAIAVPLAMGGSVSGTVVDPSGSPIPNICVSLTDEWWDDYYGGACTGDDGTYRTSGVADGEYWIVFSDPEDRYATQWYPNASSAAGATAVNVTVGNNTAGVDARMQSGARIAGNIATKQGEPLAGWVSIYDESGEYWVDGVDADADGNYTTGRLPTGVYSIRASATDYAPSWLGGKNTVTDSTRIAISGQQADDGVTVGGADFELALGGVISGTILDEDGASPSWACAEVYEADTGEYLEESCTDYYDSGEYQVTGLPRGEFQIRFSGSGLVTEWFEDAADQASATRIQLTDASPDATVSAVLASNASLHGTVFDDSTGEPVSVGSCGVTVLAYDADLAVPSYYPVATSCVNAQGKYSLAVPEEGDYKVRYAGGQAYGSEWYDNVATYDEATLVHLVPSVRERQDASLEPTASIAGNVTVDGSPSDSAYIAVYRVPDGSYSYPSWVASGYADDEGRYRVFGLTAGDFLVRVSDEYGNGISEWYDNSPDWQGATRITLTKGQTRRGIDVDLAPGGRIVGTVVDPDGQPVAGCTARVWSTDYSRFSDDCPGGEFGSGLPTGTYRVEIQASGFVTQLIGGDAGVEVTAGEVTDVGEIRLERAAVVTGRVTTDDTGLPVSAYVYAYPSASDSSAGYGYSGVYGSSDDGTYRIDTLPAGDYEFQVVPYPGMAEWYQDKPDRDSADTLTLAADGTTRTVDFSISTGHRISGTVTTRFSGEPVAASVSLQRVYADGSFSYAGWTTADSTGAFQFSGLPDGDYALYVTRDGLNSQYYDGAATLAEATTISVRGANVNAISVRMTRRPSVTGTVTTESGAPLESAQIYLQSVESGWSYGAWTGADGTFSVSVPEPGDYHLRFNGPSGEAYLSEYWDNSPGVTTASTISVSAQQYDDGVDLAGFDAALTRAPYTISGTVTDADGSPIPYLSVAAGWRQARTNRLGQYDIGVTPGMWKVLFGADEYVYGQAYQEFRPEYYPDAPSPADAQVVTVDENDPDTHHLTGIDGSLEIGGSITGRITDMYSGAGLGSTSVRAMPLDWNLPTRYTSTSSDGTYRIPGLASGTYRLSAQYNGYDVYSAIYRVYGGTTSLESGTQFDVALGQDTPGIDVQISRARPLVPDGFTAQAGSRAVKLSWQPADTRGNDLRRYEVEVQPGGITHYIESYYKTTELTIDGLENGTEYEARIRTLTDAGWSSWSDSVAFTPGTLLEWTAPPIATRDDGSIRVRWTPPTTNGTTIRGYTAQAYDADGNPVGWGGSAGADDTSTTVNGLTNGQPYTVVVSARNEVGSTDSGPSNEVVPAGPPKAPPRVGATRGDRAIDVTWDVADSNGAPILGYTVTARRSNGATTIVATGPDATSARIEGLVNGAVYTVSVAGTNDVGQGSEESSSAVTPAGVPEAPTVPTVEPRDGALAVRWSEPDENGSPILEYRVTRVGGDSMLVPATTKSTALTGLDNGTPYQVSVAARNDVGWGVESPVSDPVTPGPVPATPTDVTASADNGTARVAWLPPAQGVLPLDGYIVEAQPGDLIQQVGPMATSADVDGLLANTEYTVRVRAVNAAGPGEWTEPLTVFWDTRAPTVQISSLGGTVVRPSEPDTSTERILVTCEDNVAVATLTAEIRDEGDALVRSDRLIDGDCASGAHLVWDGRDDNGDLLADGIYRASLTATDASGNVRTVTRVLAVDLRVPARIGTPATGSDVYGEVRVVVEPDATLEQVQVVSGERTANLQAANGSWSGRVDLEGLPLGVAALGGRVYWRDLADRLHVFELSPVTVDVIDSPITIDAALAPTEGEAPLPVELQMVADNGVGPMDVRVDWGDGTARTQQSLTPGESVTLQHEYPNTGTYTASATVFDEDGSRTWTQQVSVRPRVNRPPTADLRVTPDQGVAPLTVTATLDIADSDGDRLRYAIDYGDGTGEWRNGVSDGQVELTHTYRRVGTFPVQLQVYDGQEWVTQTAAVTVSSPAPLKASAGDDRVVTVGQPVDFDGSASQPTNVPLTFNWNFGDGRTGGGVDQSHAYTEPGDYTVTLTVGDGKETDADHASITVVEPSAGSGLTVAVEGSNNRLPGATVALIDDLGQRYSCVTGAVGDCALSGVPDGHWAVHAYAPGFLPKTATAVVTGGKGDMLIELPPGDVAQATVTHERLLGDELKKVAADLGIDLDDPENQNLIRYFITIGGRTLTCVASAVTCHQTGGSGGSGGAWDNWRDANGNRYSPSVRVVDGQPTMTVLVTGATSWLKEFFRVKLVVVNLAEPQFTLSEGQAQLDLPAGVSLAPTTSPQSRVVDLPDIPGQQTQEFTWIVRGDKKGDYDLSAVYSALLQPLGAPVSLVAETDEPMHVWGTDAVRLDVTADDTAYKHLPYPVEVELTNVADVPLYNVSLRTAGTDTSTSLLQPQQQTEERIAELAPGSSVTLPLRLVPRQSMQTGLQDALLEILVTGEAITRDVSLRAPSVTPATAPKVTVDTTKRKRAILSWDPIPGASGYRVFVTQSDDTPFGPDPVVEVDAATTTATVPQEAGTTAFYAVSAVVDGRAIMYHPLQAAVATLGSAPKLTVTAFGLGKINAGSLVDVASQGQEFVIEAEDRDQQIADIDAYGTDGGFYFDPSWSEHLDCDDHVVALDDSTAGLLCRLPQGDYLEDVIVIAKDEDGHSDTLTFHVGTEYVAMGDSYSSGEGAVPASESKNTLGPDRWWFGDTDDLTNMCHRSTEAYPKLLRGSKGIPNRLTFLACSGAETWNVNPEGKGPEGQEPAPKWPSERIQADGRRPHASIVTLSIGGNDAGFSEVILKCALTGIQPVGSGCQALLQGDVKGAMAFLGKELPRTYRSVLQATPNADIYVMGYPKFFKAAWYNINRCPASVLSLDGLIMGISPADQVFINSKVEQANRAIQDAISAVGNARLHYVDVYDAFEGHFACESDPWMNDLEDASRATWEKVLSGLNYTLEDNAVYSFHPNRDGHARLADVFHEAITKDQSTRQKVGPGQTKTSTVAVAVRSATLQVATGWPGSDVVTHLTSPSGRVIDRTTTAADVVHEVTGTSEVYRVTDPEPGEWTITSFGADVEPDGEDLRTATTVVPEVRERPIASATASVKKADVGQSVTFDASESRAADGDISEYYWEFGDGTFGYGRKVEHAYEDPGTFTAEVTVVDGAGGVDAVAVPDIEVTAVKHAAFSADPGTLGFGDQLVGSVSGKRAVTVTNTGDTPLVFGPGAVSLAGDAPGQFAVAGDACSGREVAPGQACVVEVTFSPSGAGVMSAQVRFVDNAAGSPHTVALTGTGTRPVFSVDPGSLAFGDQLVGSVSGKRAVTVTNTGDTPLVFGPGAVSLAGDAPGQFAVAGDACSGREVAPGQACVVEVTFSPSGAGVKSAQVRFVDNAAGSPHTVALTGTGTSVPVPPTTQEPVAPPPVLAVPPAPSRLKAKASTKKVRATWRAASGATSYRVTLKGKTKRNKKVTRTARVGSTSAALKVALKKKSTFRVCVAAVNASGTSAAACRSGKVK